MEAICTFTVTFTVNRGVIWYLQVFGVPMGMVHVSGCWALMAALCFAHMAALGTGMDFEGPVFPM
jgi:hypothetical protein